MEKGYTFCKNRILYSVLEIKYTPFGSYALLERTTEHSPFVVAWNVQKEKDGSLSWGQGHYFESIIPAVKDFCDRAKI